MMNEISSGNVLQTSVRRLPIMDISMKRMRTMVSRHNPVIVAVVYVYFIFTKRIWVLAPLFQNMCFDVCLALQYFIRLFLSNAINFKTEQPNPFCFIFLSSASFLLNRPYLGFVMLVTICTTLLNSISSLGTSYLCVHHDCSALHGSTRSCFRMVFGIWRLPW